MPNSVLLHARGKSLSSQISSMFNPRLWLCKRFLLTCFAVCPLSHSSSAAEPFLYQGPE